MIAIYFPVYILSCQVRSGDLDGLFSHENQVTLPSLVDANLFNGAAVVLMLKPGTVKSFQEYADKVFLPYVFQ